ncbi:MAG: hypothetical protein IJ069_01525 [Prevotella sp.]|nr:hypothetical protein [Prevotella sp.]
MEQISRPVKKPSGCLNFFGWLLTIGSALFILMCILMTIGMEDSLDEKREEYAAAEKEYEEALEAYNADSVHLQAEYQRIQSQIEKADEAGDSALVAELTDSLVLYAEPEYHPRGAIGFNIGGVFFLFFAVLALVPLAAGIALIIYCRNRKLKYKRYLENRSC